MAHRGGNCKLSCTRIFSLFTSPLELTFLLEHKRSQVQSPTEITFLLNLCCCSLRKPLLTKLPTLCNYGKKLDWFSFDVRGLVLPRWVVGPRSSASQPLVVRAALRPLPRWFGQARCVRLSPWLLHDWHPRNLWPSEHCQCTARLQRLSCRLPMGEAMEGILENLKCSTCLTSWLLAGDPCEEEHSGAMV